MHGMSETRFYNIWSKMKERCLNRNSQNYERYGGEGIQVCGRWHTFDNFKDDMHESYLKHAAVHGENKTTLDRIQSKGNYEPGNCRWVTLEQQSQNKTKDRDRNRFVAISPEGKIYIHYHQKNFAIEHNLSPSGICDCLRGRLRQHKGWSFYKTEERK